METLVAGRPASRAEGGPRRTRARPAMPTAHPSNGGGRWKEPAPHSCLEGGRPRWRPQGGPDSVFLGVGGGHWSGGSSTARALLEGPPVFSYFSFWGTPRLRSPGREPGGRPNLQFCRNQVTNSPIRRGRVPAGAEWPSTSSHLGTSPEARPLARICCSPLRPPRSARRHKVSCPQPARPRYARISLYETAFQPPREDTTFRGKGDRQFPPQAARSISPPWLSARTAVPVHAPHYPRTVASALERRHHVGGRGCWLP